MSNDFFSDRDNAAELVSHMPEEDRKRYENYGHNRVEPAFIDRVFIVYKPTGLTPGPKELGGGRHREPQILTTVKVIDFGVEVRDGCYTVLKEVGQTDQELTIGHVPKKLFHYPIYVSIPPRLMLRWDCRTVNGRAWRSLSFALLIKTKNDSKFFSAGNVYMETPNKFREYYPSVTGQFSF